jgi:hypothetical protein
MQPLLQQFLVKHGDVITLRTLHLNAAGSPGWLYVGSHEATEIAHSLDLPISDHRFQWQVLKLSPNVTGGNQNPTYVTEGDDILLKSLANGLTLTLPGKTCGLNVARAQVGEQVAIGNYYTSGEGGVSTVQLVDANGGASKDRAVVYGLRPYAIKLTNSHCFVSAQPHKSAGTAAAASQYESFLIMPPTGALQELEARARLIGDVPLVQQEAALQGAIDSAHGLATPFSQQAGGPAGNRKGLSVMVADVPSADVWPIVLGIAIVALIGAGYWYYRKRRTSRK